MHTEFEAKILDIDVDELVSTLDKIGAKKVSDKMQKRLVYDFIPKRENSFIRLRTDGAKTTLAIKEIHNDRIDGTKEIEVSVDDFENASLLLEKLGFAPKGYQENKRISYELDKARIEIDFWPMIPAYVEIEADSADEVHKMISKLGFDLSQATSINTKEVYKKYGIDVSKIKKLILENKG